MNPRSLYLFDVSNLFYRCFYGSDPLTTSYGMPVQGLHGFVRAATSIMRDHKPSHVAFVMEGGGENPRKKIEPLYKANRGEPPEDLILQLKMLPEMMSAMGYPTFKFEGFEGDDVIASLAEHAFSRSLDTTIVSADKDYNQIVKPGIKVFNPSKGEFVDENAVYLKYGVRPDQFLDFLSIVGDSSDNIKGVKGIGEKGAAELINHYGSLDSIYEWVDGIKGAKRQKLVDNRDDAYKARELIRFMKAPVDQVDFDTWCVYGGPRVEEVRALFRRLEFKELESILLSKVVNVEGTELGVKV